MGRSWDDARSLLVRTADGLGAARLTTLLAGAGLVAALPSLVLATLPLPAATFVGGAIRAGLLWIPLATETAALLLLLQAPTTPSDAPIEMQEGGGAPERYARVATDERWLAATRRSDELEEFIHRSRNAVASEVARLTGSSDTLNGSADELSRAALRITSETIAASVAVEDTQRKIESMARGHAPVRRTRRIHPSIAKRRCIGSRATHGLVGHAERLGG